MELEVGEVAGTCMHSIWLEPKFLEVVTTPEEAMSAQPCSFCGKSPQDGQKLVASRTLFICDECAQGCVRALADAHPAWINQRLEFVKGLRKSEAS